MDPSLSVCTTIPFVEKIGLEIVRGDMLHLACYLVQYYTWYSMADGSAHSIANRATAVRIKPIHLFIVLLSGGNTIARRRGAQSSVVL